MTKLTAKQRAFAENVAQGMKGRQAAQHAGYSHSGIDQQAHALSQHSGVKAEIRALRRQREIQGKGKQTDNGAPADGSPRMLPKYASSLALLQHTYNNPKMADSVRIEAAKQALPYEHARIGEKGKKESAIDRAKEVIRQGRSRGDGPHRKPLFAPHAPPKLTSRVVQGAPGVVPQATTSISGQLQRADS